MKGNGVVSSDAVCYGSAVMDWLVVVWFALVQQGKVRQKSKG